MAVGFSSTIRDFVERFQRSPLRLILKYVALRPDVAVASVNLRQTLNLTFFDLHYAAVALNQDRGILSFDQSYDRVKGPTLVDPATI